MLCNAVRFHAKTLRRKVNTRRFNDVRWSVGLIFQQIQEASRLGMSGVNRRLGWQFNHEKHEPHERVAGGQEFRTWQKSGRRDWRFDHGRRGRDGRIATVPDCAFSCGSCLSWLLVTLATRWMQSESTHGRHRCAKCQQQATYATRRTKSLRLEKNSTVRSTKDTENHNRVLMRFSCSCTVIFSCSCTVIAVLVIDCEPYEIDGDPAVRLHPAALITLRRDVESLAGIQPS